MIYIGIDVAKYKHDCCIIGSDADVLCPTFTIPNNRSGFETLRDKILAITNEFSQVKVGLEATGHYSSNILAFLMQSGFTVYVINPLYVNLHRKSLSLRKAKTDKIDAKSIATILMTDRTLKPYLQISYHNEELKSLCRYRQKKVNERAKLKIAVTNLIDLLFPEIELLVSTVHSNAVYKLLRAFPSAEYVAGCHLTKLKHLLRCASMGRFGDDMAISVREAARNSIGLNSPAKSMELQHTIKSIEFISQEIDEIDAQIKKIVDIHQSPITSIPGISYTLGAMIIAEIGDFRRFSSADKILAFAGLSPTIYQSGQLTGARAHMEKRGSFYLRYALFNAAKQVCNNCEVFRAYLKKKLNEGKHYYVAISHAARKLIRLIYKMELTGEPYRA